MDSQNTTKCKRTSKPDWLKIRLQHSEKYARVSSLVDRYGLHTICSSGKCPNISECWSAATATFLIAGDICTRKCRFCATATGRPLPLDINEPKKIARSIQIMELKHAVITSVDRDDLEDGGALHWKNTVEAIKTKCPDTTIEILIPDFDSKPELIDIVLAAGAHIIGHNLETVKRITPLVRSRATYSTSLDTLKYLSDKGADTKSGIMVGLGETFDEVVETLKDLYDVGVRRVTIGQYLQPTKQHLEVSEYVTPETFDKYKEIALDMGFKHVESAPMVRSSYHAKL
ncbi:MAG: lipoyl synthase [Rikenellaceae bacterium]